MPRGAYRRSSRARSGPKRRTQWENATLGATTLSTGVGATDLVSGWYTNVRAGLTLLRSIGEFFIRSSAGTATNWGMGIIQMDEESAAAGAFPEPRSDGERLWIVRETGNAFDVDEWVRYHWDVRGRRAFRRHNDRIYLLVENLGADLIYGFGMRNLYALP